ncbi:odorant receptor 47a-like [Cimex lectularius]|uniref:Odorant receptor n=1 Tax=Cimex lectularius TaxID=79782 RepID=A0A8I6S8H8_CIMLE|nr:odorant receptor 47a-like [Cimex lectularius]XP_014258534.1 odorant receptor 47a-like [Cimex lectularius]XP_014258536.1 odorant receptor 47a-like [Cimex lectularius]
MQSKCIKFARLGLQLAGIIPMKNSYNHFFSFKLLSFNGKLTMLVCGIISFMFAIQSELTKSFTAWAIFSVSVQLVLKQYTTHKNDFAKMLDDADRLLESVLTDQKAREIFEPMDSIRIKFCKVFVYSLLCYMPLNFFSNVLDYFSGRPLRNPFQLWTPFSSILLSFVFHSYILSMAIITESSYLNSIASVSLHVVSCLKILSHRLSKQPQFISKKVERETIKIHSDVIQLVALMNKNYGAMITLEILSASLQACFTGYQILVGLENLDSNLLVFFVVFIFIWELPFIICYCGQEIETESETILRALYQNLWHQRSPENRKTVFFQMLMMSKPLKLHFRNFIVFNFAQLGGVLQSAYTAMAMMRLLFI